MLVALQENGFALHFVAVAELQSDRNVLKAVQQNGFDPHFAAAKIKTSRNVLDVAQQDSFALHFAAATELGTNHDMLEGSRSALL